MLMREENAMTYALEADTGNINVSPDAFRLSAKDFYQCRLSFQCSDRYSPVPYFLLCRAIELKFKAIHLERQGQKEVKKYGHDLMRSYEALPAADQTLSTKERLLLKQASKIYDNPVKGFEYFNVHRAAC